MKTLLRYILNTYHFFGGLIYIIGILYNNSRNKNKPYMWKDLKPAIYLLIVLLTMALTSM